MNFSGYELQIFVSVLIVLGCAFVALLVDYLKGSNEKLRESHVDLLARQDNVINKASADTSMLLKALGDQTSALRAMINRPIHVTTTAMPVALAPAYKPAAAPLPVSSIPTPKRQSVAEPAPELEKVKVALIPETQVLAPAIVPEPIPEPIPAPIPEAIPQPIPAPLPEPMVALTPLPEPVVPAPPMPAPAFAEEVLPPNVIRIRLMPDLHRRETKPELEVEVEEPVSESPLAEVAQAAELEVPPAELPAPVEVEVVAEELTPALAPQEPIEERAPVGFFESELEAAVSEDSSVAETATPTEPDFDRFLDDLVTEFESQPDIYQDAPAPEPPLPAIVPEPEPVHSMSSLPVLPTLGFSTDSNLLGEDDNDSNVAEFTPNLDVPLGTHPSEVLATLLERKELLTGLVVSVGINEYGQIHENLGRSAADELLRSVDSLMGSLAAEDGFCTRKSQDEFILIFAKVSGPAAQRRLSEISERLWDFQLRNLGTFSVVFSWGANEAQRETLTDAIAAATERKNETQSSRKSASVDRSRRRRATA